MPSAVMNFENIQRAIVQIATPECTGRGTILAEEGFIVTSQHLVEGTPNVVISNNQISAQLAKVVYTDEIYDIALIELPKVVLAGSVQLSKANFGVNDTIIALEKEIKTGNITKEAHSFLDVEYIETNIQIDTDYNGSPLLNAKGEIIGIHSGLIQYGLKDIGYALPSHYILKIIADYKKSASIEATRCRNCQNIVTPTSIQNNNQCPNCQNEVELPSSIPAYRPQGVSRTIEELIQDIGHEPVLTRRGPKNWALIEGSATIYLAYYEPRGYIMGDAFLCQLPDNQNLDKIYEFLLRQNYQMNGLTFSVNQKDIVLSLIIYDRHLNTDTAKELLQNLLERADYYDNVLVEEYGAVWK